MKIQPPTRPFVFSCIFLAVLFAPAAQMIFPVFPELASTEKRTLAPMPSLQRGSIGDFPQKFELFFNDHFGFRNWLVRCRSLLLSQSAELSAYPVSSSNRVVFGKQGWLFYNDPHDGLSLSDYEGKSFFSEDRLKRICRNLEYQEVWALRHGARLLVVICPSKHTVYPEFLPDAVQKMASPVTGLDQIADYLRGHSEFSIIDLRKPLIEAKKKFPVYYKLDTRWNDYGAFTAYREIMKKTGVAPVEISNFTVGVHPTRSGDLAEMLTLTALPDERIELSLKNNVKPEKSAEKMILFHDCFGKAVKPYLARHFDFQAVETSDWGQYWKTVLEERPRYVVLLFNERYENLLARMVSFPDAA